MNIKELKEAIEDDESLEMAIKNMGNVFEKFCNAISNIKVQ